MGANVLHETLATVLFPCFREVLASPLALNVPHRVDWKACSSSKEEESAAAKKMRQNFQPFDFTE